MLFKMTFIMNYLLLDIIIAIDFVYLEFAYLSALNTSELGNLMVLV